MLAERDIHIDVTPEARARIAEVGYEPAFGARPLKRAIQRLISDPLAMAFLEGTFDEGDAIRIDLDAEGAGLTFSAASGEPSAAADEQGDVEEMVSPG